MLRDVIQCLAAKRRLYRFGVPALVCLVLLVSWQDSRPVTKARSLSLHHTHTGKSITVTYHRDGAYVPEALEALDEFLEDFRTGDEGRMDPALFDLLHDIQRAAGSDGTYEVISAYRSPATNAMLRKNSSGVAKKSQHLLGKAIDVRLTDVDTARLRDVALSLKRGGVGYYRASDFVHVDTGRVRRW
jgi:uncharacterized protein YcbK (DUF882 family)